MAYEHVKAPLLILAGAAIGAAAFGIVAYDCSNKQAEMLNNQIHTLEQKVADDSKTIISLVDRIDSLKRHISEKDSLNIRIDRIVAIEDLNLDYTKHPDYGRFADIEPYLDDAIQENMHIFPVSKLLMIALLKQESIYGSLLVSPAGAHGYWQMIPTTAREEGLFVGLNDNFELSAHYRRERKLIERQIDSLENSLALFRMEHLGGIDPMNEDQARVHLSMKKLDLLPLYESLIHINKTLAEERKTARRFEKQFLAQYYVESLEKVRKYNEGKLSIAELSCENECYDKKKQTYAVVRHMAKLLLASNGNIFVALVKYNADKDASTILPYKETTKYILNIVNEYITQRRTLVNGTKPLVLAGPSNK